MHRRRPPLPITVIAVAALSVLVAGCGGASSTTTTKTAGTTPTPSGALAYARCMRSQGVGSFPDPTGENNKQAIVSALKAVGSSKGKAASTACMHVNDGSPGTGQGGPQTQSHPGAMLAFAHCLRSHGFRNFPDPNSSGQLTPEMVTEAGIDLHQPGLLRSADRCVSVTHGALTKADVARAVNQPSAAGQ